MANKLFRSVAFLVACASASFAYAGGVAYYNFVAGAGDNTASVLVYGYDLTGGQDPKSVANIEDSKDATKGDADAIVIVSAKAGNGSLGVSASAFVTVGAPPVNRQSTVGDVDATVKAILTDQLTFDFGGAQRLHRVVSLFTFDGDLDSSVKGAYHTSPNYDYDWVDASASAGLRIYGSGLTPGAFNGPPGCSFGCYAATESIFDSHATINTTGNNSVIDHTQVYVSLDVIPNVPIDVAWTMELLVKAVVQNHDIANHQSGRADVSANFGHTLAWGGIISITDETTGEAITDWTVTSASGFNYANPAGVPEPSGFVLIAVAFVGLTARGYRLGRN
jgi:hypothetical protein